MPRHRKHPPSPPGTEASAVRIVRGAWAAWNDRLARPRVRRWCYAGAFLLLLLNLLEFPHHAYDVTHDLSSHATFEYYAAQGFQFGKQVYQNVGPYGFVHYAYSYIGYLHTQKVLLRNITRFVLVCLIFWAMRRLPHRWLKIAWWLGFFLFLPLGDDTPDDYLDTDEDYAYLLLYLAALFNLQSRRDRRFYAVSAVLVCLLAFLALTKHTCFVLAVAATGAAVLQKSLERDFKGAALHALWFPLCLAGHWVMASQHLENLPLFVKGIFAFSDGYNEAMAINEPGASLWFGLALLLPLWGRVLWNGLFMRDGIGRLLFEGFLIFVIWKHAYVRADAQHVTIFYYAALFLAPMIFWGRLTAGAAPGWKSVACGAAVIAVAFAAFFEVIPQCRYRPARLANHLQHNLAWLVAPGHRTAEMRALLRQAQADYDMPEVRKEVGGARIDFFGYEPGFLLLNGLNYWPRPMPITFAAANGALLRANEAFYRDPQTAPEYVLCKIGGVDDRFLYQDDALALNALRELYYPVRLGGKLLLLKRHESPPPILPRKLVAELRVPLGKTISLEPLKGQGVWMEAEVERTGLGRLQSFFYKPAPCYIGYHVTGQPEMYFSRYVTSMGPSGAMLNPVVGSSYELLNLYAPQPEWDGFQAITDFHLTTDPSDRKYFKNEAVVRLYVWEEEAVSGGTRP